MADVVSQVVSYFKAKGLPDAAIAAILGNMQTESSFNTGAVNGNEGAIGLAQWEGGRRSALQQFAASEGKSETDLGAQLDFMWHELTTNYNGVLQQMQHATDPAQAAAIWDGQYEVSSGSSRQQRIQNAVNFANNGLQGGPGVESAQALTASPVNGSMNASQTPEQLKQALESGLGSLSSLLNVIPELNGILNTAISKGWTAQEFQNAIDNSKWYKTNSDTYREQLIQRYSDPKTYQQNVQNATTKVSQFAQSMGIRLNYASMQAIAEAGLNSGWTDQTLQQHIAALYTKTSTQGVQSGQAAQIQNQVKQIAADYGLPATQYGLNYWTQQILSGTNTIDGNKAAAMKQAQTMYAPFAQQIAEGQTMRQIADPYISAKANLLEVNPESINFASDPMIKQALQGTGASADGKPPTATPLWHFEQQVRSDPAWQMTDNAKSATASVLTQLGRDWGYAS